MLRIEWHRRAFCLLALAGLGLAGMRDARAQGSPPQGKARLDPPKATVTGIDIDGSLTGSPGAKYIEFPDGGSRPNRKLSRRTQDGGGDDTTTWTATVLKSPSTVFFSERGGVRVSAKMTSLVMTCLNAPDGAPTPCNGTGSFFVQSESTPGDGSCRSRMDPPSLHIDFKPNASDTTFVMLRYVDPAPGAPAGDYEGWGALEWTADVVVEQDPAGKTACVNAGRRPKQDFVMYVLNTGTAGAAQFSRGMKTLSGRCAAAGGLGLQGGECTGEEESFVWSFQRNAATPR